MERLREESKDLLWGAEVVEEDMAAQSMERLDQLEERAHGEALVSGFGNSAFSSL